MQIYKDEEQSPSTSYRTGFGKVAPFYTEQGFKPFPVSGKLPMVVGATGRNGKITLKKITEWCRHFPRANTAIRAQGWVAIDVDHYDGKTGADQLLQLEELFGVLPVTISSTARGRDSLSRQYFFRVRRDVALNSDPTEDIEIIHKFHRYCVVAPSQHPKLNKPYIWYDAKGEEMQRLPTILDFAVLPPGWVAGLSRANTAFKAEGIYEGALDEWIEWLGEDEPFYGGLKLEHDIQAAIHIGHNQLLKFVYRIHQTRLEGDDGMKRIYLALLQKFKATTNNPDWERELTDAVRWTVGKSWTPSNKESTDNDNS